MVTAEVENSGTNTGALARRGAGIQELEAANSDPVGSTVSTGTLLANNGITGSATGTREPRLAEAAEPPGPSRPPAPWHPAILARPLACCALESPA